MDKDFQHGVIGTVTVLVAIIAAVTTGIIWSGQQQIQFEQVCVSSHRNVVYREVDGQLVSECK